MICNKCGREAENPHLMFKKFSDIGIDDNQFAININEEPPSAQCLCDECYDKEKITVDGIVGAIKGFKVCESDGVYYYVHGGREKRETGLSVEDVVERFSNDLSVVVVDPKQGRYYRAGKRILNKKFKGE